MQNNLLYKYSSLNGHTFKNILLSKLRFNPPHSMNDQLEGIVTVEDSTFKPTEEAIKKFAKKYNISKNQLSKSIAKNGFIPIFLANEVESDFRSFEISCFSKRKEESLMWAHYADKHSGVCLIYDKTVLLKSLEIITSGFECSEITYSAKPRIRLIEKNGEVSYQSDIPIISAKDKNWQYEDEVRIFLKPYYEKPGHSYFISNKALVGIIYGCRIQSDDKDSISMIFRNDPNYAHVKEYSEIIDMVNGRILIEGD